MFNTKHKLYLLNILHEYCFSLKKLLLFLLLVATQLYNTNFLSDSNEFRYFNTFFFNNYET